MGEFIVQGLDELIRRMTDMSETTGEIVDEMLLSSAEIVKAQWKRAAEQAGHHDTGTMISRISYGKRVYQSPIDGVKSVSIYPSGTSKTSKEKTGFFTRNDVIAFRVNYGTSKMPGSHFKDVAEAASAEPVRKNMQQRWGNYLKQKGLI